MDGYSEEYYDSSKVSGNSEVFLTKQIHQQRKGEKQMTREELTKLTVKELDQMCKDYGFPRYKGKTHLNKTEMINNLLRITTEDVTETKVKEQHEEVLANDSSKDVYIQNAKIGSLIAFLDKKKLTRTGKIVEINSEKKHITVELKSGKKFYILYDDVLWVTTDENRRWPKKILYALKESQQRIEEEYKNKINNCDVSPESIEKLNQKFRLTK